MRILIVDDIALSRKVLRQALRCSGIAEAEVREAEDGMQALAMLSKEPADLLFCDLHMPRVDGRTLLASLQRSGRLEALQVVILSSEAHHLTDAERTGFGITSVARKPVRPEEIQAIIAGATTGGRHD
jgi:CheY-like chemotaxis protein